MKTKHYEFTEIEMFAIRDALDSQWFTCGWRDRKPGSPMAKDLQKAIRSLLDQFREDCSKI